MHPKDAGMIIAYTGIGKNSIVVEAGAGSGFFTIALANICKKVYAYEWKKEFFELATNNLKRVATDNKIDNNINNVELKNKNIFEGIEEKEVDLVTLDLPNAEKCVALAHNALKNNGWLTGYFPNIEQAKIFYIECHKIGFSEIFALENIVREYEIREYGVRPIHVGLMHTAYLIFAKK
ncbi:MAG: rRNA adenine N-6-methyltransferase family protein [Candidatus Micrarchaeota archaeon]